MWHTAANGAGDAIVVLEMKLAELVLPERVDVIICGSLGYTITNGGAAEDFVRARDAHLKPGGVLFPTRATLFTSVFTDEALFNEQVSVWCWCVDVLVCLLLVLSLLFCYLFVCW